MKNPHSPLNRIKKALKSRWENEDFPGAKPRFQIALFGKDLGIYLFLPISAVVVFKSCEMAITDTKKPVFQRFSTSTQAHETSRSQIIDFHTVTGGSTMKGVARRAPGTLVKVRLLNTIETYANAPVHAQIIDAGLGKSLIGSTIIGDATSDTNFNRIEMNFHFIKDLRNTARAIPIAARALSMNGTLGITARKKEGFFARAALNSTGNINQNSEGKADDNNLNHIIAKALTAGLIQEFSNDTQTERNRA